MAFGPGPDEVVTASNDGCIRIWQWKTGQVRELTGHKGPVRAIVVSPDGQRLLSGGEDGTVRLWLAATGEPEPVFPSLGASVNSAAFTADGRCAVSGGSDRNVRLWELPE